MSNQFNIGFFGDDIWAHKTLKLFFSDKTLKLNFICARFKTKDTFLKKIAKKKNVKFFRFKNVNNQKFINYLKESRLDLLVSMSYDQIFKNGIINLFKKKIINCHAGKLPFYRGRSVLNWVLINGEKEFGITTHFVNEHIDKGNIINQKIIKISKKDDFKSLLYKSYSVCSRLLYKSVKQIQNNRFQSIPQNRFSKKSSYYIKRKNGDEIINLKKSALEIQNFVRGLVEPGPYAKIKLKKNLLYVKKVSITKKKNGLESNTLKFKKGKFFFLAGDKKIVSIDNWVLKKRIKNKELIKLR